MNITFAMPEWLAITIGVLLLVSSALNLVNAIFTIKLRRLEKEATHDPR